MILNKRLFASYLALILNLAAVFVAGQGMDLNCDPCIDRPTYRIQVIVHGTSDDKFWQRTRASSIQAGKDMRVDLDFELYDVFDPKVMAADIEAAATGPSPPDALIVSIPSPVVESAVSKATEYIPIFGMNSGYDLATRVGVLDFIAMDERLGGVVAAEEFLKENSNITRALYINHQKGNTALDERFIGFQQGLVNASVDELEVDVTLPGDIEKIARALEGCEYEAVLLAGSESTLDLALDVFDMCPNHFLGTFDEGATAYEAIATGKLLFVVSQQAHLQGTLSVVAAAIYATTEKKLSSSQATFGTYLSGPITINFSNLPSDTLQRCEDDGFPVCPNTFAEDGISSSLCDCQDRSKIKIAGVLHGVTTDLFWDVVFAQARQAADDLGVELKLDRLEPQPSSELLHSKMAQQIISLCNEGVDGIFISVPSELIHKAVQTCQDLNIPVISVNSGASFAEMLGVVHHIAQLEYDAGLKAGSAMAKEGVTAGICLPHDDANEALTVRCNGFEAGMKAVSPNITYLGNPIVPIDNKLVYIDEVEKIIGRSGDWEGIGAMSIGPKTLGSLMAVKERHSKLLVGTFDVNNEIFDELKAGRILFGIDQNPFMQGYMPVWLLTIMAHTKQRLRNPYIQTGPRFVEDVPSNALKICTENHFNVCARPVDSNFNHLKRVRPYGLTLAGISMFLSVALMAWVFYNRNAAVVRKSQPLFLGMICAGTFLMAATIIPLSIDDSIASDETCTIACIATPWFFCIGFVIAFSALFSKIDRIKRLLKNSEKFRRVTITAWDVMQPFAILLTLTLIFLLVWSVVDPMFWVRKPVLGSTDGLSTFGACSIGQTNVAKAMLACLIVLDFVCVIMACLAAWYARTVSVEFSESKYISVIMIGMLQTFPIGIPLIVLTYSNPTASYFVKAALLFFLTVSILSLIFIPKIIFLRKEKVEKADKSSSAPNFVSTLRGLRSNQFSTPDPMTTTGLTKKEVEDLQQLLIKIGTIDETTDLRSLVQSIGIVISDEGLLRSSINLLSSTVNETTNETPEQVKQQVE